MIERSQKAESILNEKINHGHHTYKQYLEEEYGRMKTKRMMEEKNKTVNTNHLRRHRYGKSR